MNLHLAILIGYSVALVLLGLWISRRVKGTKDFFVAGRGLGPGLLFSTLLAANIGAGSTVGATGLGYRDGLAAWWWVGSAALGSFLLAFWIGPAIRRVAAERDLRTVGDYLEYRYGRGVRGVVAVLLWIGSLAILAAQLIAMSFILDVIAGVPKALGCAVGGALITIYFAAGGLKTSVWVNVVQLVVKFAGFFVALPLALAAVGGWDAVRSMPVPADDYWNFFAGGQSGLVYIALLTPAFIVSPGILQKLYAARDDRAVRLGVGWSAVGLLVYAIVPVLLGMIARARVPELPASDMALPWILMNGVPPLVGSIGLAAVFSAELSAADAVLFMLTTSLSQDMYRRFVRPDADDATVLRVARITAVVAGALGTWLAIISPSVISAMTIFYTLLGVTLFVPIVAGLYVRRAGTPEAAAAMAAGVFATVGLHLATGGRGIGWLTPALAGLLLAVAGFILVLLARGGSPPQHKVTTT